ncbi:MAG: type III pantothenate kinase [Faecalimonas sp.]|nr:type III pantothenate kinase [Faecalimonas sp.]
MLLVIDVGNTHITLGVFDGKELKATFRMTAKQPRTSDEYGIQLCELLTHRDFGVKDIEDVVISSVVPDVMHSLGSAIIKYFHLKPIVPTAEDMGLVVNTEHPKEVGRDRIVDAVAAYEKYGGPVIVIDFGTATTYDVVTTDGVFEGGLISPGIRTSARALWGGAAMLPEIEIRKPKSVIAKETVSSMQGGLVYGYIGQTEYIIKRMKEEGFEGAKVVATGGLGNIIVPETDMIDIYDPHLTLEGLRIIYEKKKKAEAAR